MGLVIKKIDTDFVICSSLKMAVRKQNEKSPFFWFMIHWTTFSISPWFFTIYKAILIFLGSEKSKDLPSFTDFVFIKKATRLNELYFWPTVKFCVVIIYKKRGQRGRKLKCKQLHKFFSGQPKFSWCFWIPSTTVAVNLNMRVWCWRLCLNESVCLVIKNSKGFILYVQIFTNKDFCSRRRRRFIYTKNNQNSSREVEEKNCV